jgi:hypothetical protein
VWFLGLLLVVAASLGWATVLPTWHLPLVGIALVAAWLAADARQNGFPAMAVVGGAAAWLMFGSRRHRWLLVIAASALVVLFGMAAQRGARVVAVQKDVSPEQVLYFQDLLAVSLRLDDSQVPQQLMSADRLDDVRRLWVPAQVGSVLFRTDPPVDYRPYEGSGPRTRALRDAWFEMIANHPFAYIVERADLYRRLLGVGDAVPGAWYEISDRLPYQGSRDLQQRFSGLNDIRSEFLQVFDSGAPGSGGPFHDAWLYVALGLGSALAIVAAGTRLRVFGWAMLALQISMQLVLGFAATLLEYRFELFQVVLGIALAVIAARSWWERLRFRGAPNGAEPRRRTSTFAPRSTAPAPAPPP